MAPTNKTQAVQQKSNKNKAEVIPNQDHVKKTRDIKKSESSRQKDFENNIKSNTKSRFKTMFLVVFF